MAKLPPPSANHRRRGFEPAFALMAPQVRAAGEARGFAVARLVTHWPEVAGADIARVTRPVKVGYGREGMGATLTLLVQGAHAPMIEMQKDRIRERVNAVYGYNAIARVHITQTAAGGGFAEGQTPFAPAPTAPPPDPALTEQAAQAAAMVGDAGLRDALERLGRNVLSRCKAEKGKPMTTMNRRALMAMGAAIAAAKTTGAAWAQETAPATPAAPEIKDFSLGDPNAPVKMVEYASFTCPHCAKFHTTVFKPLKTEYIDTGKVHFTLKEVYFDRYGLWAALVARCGGDLRYFGIADVVLSTQSEWAASEDPNVVVQNLRNIGLAAGLTAEALDACMADAPMVEAMFAHFEANMAADKIEGTPTLFVNGEKHPNMAYEDLKAIIDEQLAG